MVRSYLKSSVGGMGGILRKRREAKNGFYPRDIAGSFGTEQDSRSPRTREGGFKPFFMCPDYRTSYDMERLVVAMYQDGCFTGDIARAMIYSWSMTTVPPEYH